ncbi:MAG: class I SAM-dependent methyltransferase [Burkholderiales bacterium]
MGLLRRLIRGRRKLSSPHAAPEILALPWRPSELSLRHRGYESYEQYVEHQVSKLGQLDLTKYDRDYRAALGKRLRASGVVKRGQSILCLGARLGTECKAFIDLGAFAIGIDLNPGAGNRYVMHGDFHALQFPDGSIDWVFTNVFDHAFDLHKMLDEATRVMKPSGGLIAEIVGGSVDDHGRDHGEFECLWWDKVEDVYALLAGHDLKVVHDTRFEFPWKGHFVVFERATAR